MHVFLNNIPFFPPSNILIGDYDSNSVKSYKDVISDNLSDYSDETSLDENVVKFASISPVRFTFYTTSLQTCLDNARSKKTKTIDIFCFLDEKLSSLSHTVFRLWRA